jgi:exodeoxyribonuclease VIII
MTGQIDFATYLGIDAVNWSTLKDLRRSPLHYKHRISSTKKETTGMRKGRVGHTAVFEPDRLALDYAVFTDVNKAGKVVRSGNVYKDFCKANKGRTILTPTEYSHACALRDAVRSHPLAAPYLERGEAEKCLEWADDETGLKCKARLDFLSSGKPALVDLKSTSDIAYSVFCARAYKMGYHCQLGFYDWGLITALKLNVPVVVIAVEQLPPYDVGVFEYEAACIDSGRDEARSLLTKLAYFREQNVWPGQYAEEMALEFPGWVDASENDDTSDLGLEE